MTVIVFPKKKKTNFVNKIPRIPRLNFSFESIKPFLIFLFDIVKIPVFLVLYWLRGIIIGLLNLVSVITLFAWLFSWYAFPEKTQMVWGFCWISLGSFVLAWVYDLVVMFLSPQAMIRDI